MAKTQAERNAAYMRKKIANETPEEREARLKDQRERTARSRAKNGQKPRIQAEVTLPTIQHTAITGQQRLDFALELSTRVSTKAYKFGEVAMYGPSVSLRHDESGNCALLPTIGEINGTPRR